MGQKGRAAINAFEPVNGDLDVVAALELNKLNAGSFDAAFFDLVEGVDFVADHCFEVLRVGSVPASR